MTREERIAQMEADIERAVDEYDEIKYAEECAWDDYTIASGYVKDAEVRVAELRERLAVYEDTGEILYNWVTM